MKKIVSLLLALVLIVAMAVPVMALDSSMTYRSVSGTATPSNGKIYSIATTTGASRTKATGEMTCDMNANLSITLKVDIYSVNGSFLRSTTFGNVETGKSVSVGGSATTPEVIKSVRATYLVNGAIGVAYTVS